MALNAKLHIETALRNGRTILKTSFCTPPFKIANVTEEKNQNQLRLMVMSSSPGILDNDEYHLQIDVTAKCSMELQTQSYQRLFQMEKGAKQSLNLNLKEESSFIYIPHPLVPHTNSIFHSKNKIIMHENSFLIWGEVMSCGRKLNGEIFKFSSYHSITEIYSNDRLVVKENILIKPGCVNPALVGQLEGYTHQASLLCVNKAMDMKEKIENILELLRQHNDIEFGVSALQLNGLVVRIMGYKAEQLFDLLKAISSILYFKTVKASSYVV